MEHLSDDGGPGAHARDVRQGDHPAARRLLAALALSVLAGGLLASARASAPAPSDGWPTFGRDGARHGETPEPVGTLRFAWFTGLPGTITSQPLVAHDVPRRGDLTVYVGTAAGYLYALAANGYVRWRADLGRLSHECTQIPDGWGVTGTPVIDLGAHVIYAADPFGRLHALDLATGRERPGWPVVLYRDFRRELVWGALLLARGSVYVPTGSYCDRPPMEGKVIRVELDTRKVTSWVSVPSSLGGGGSVWGWGGPVYSASRDSLFVGTGNAFEGGANSGAAFSEQAGYGEHLVELSPDLEVRAASGPPLGSFPDNAFVGSPIVVEEGRCAGLVAAQTKSGVLFAWRADSVGAGPLWQLALQKADPGAPLLTQPAFSARLVSFYVVTWSRLVRVALDAACRPRIAWSLPFTEPTLHGSPTIAGGGVWVALSGAPATLLGVDAESGSVRFRRRLGGISFAPPSAVDGMLFLGQMHGLSARPFRSATGRPASSVPGHVSFADARHGWQAREDGVYATDDGGRSWRRIHRSPAERVVRLSSRTGVIAIAFPAPPCGCATQRLLTTDGGRSWRKAPGIGPEFQGRGTSLYWWKGGELHRVVAWPPPAGPLRSRLVARAGGEIVSVANVPGGVVALVDRRSRSPQVIVARGEQEAAVVTLPDAGDAAVARTITAAWPSLVVRGRDYASPSALPDPRVEWRSGDGGLTWTMSRS